ncbi:hypothetical protein EJ04DRAFT_520570 [Polyplosphaeria fusca]|uniref:Uncharacterized protein n=1 Tax=Polyplosphaeria fusca TaxID=682080 RepID=A0A9P4R6Q5_9PLEO|nr:hypothetical protein EJ04DRAFT_520570 [Polyplosphaeria fusca]
MAVFQKALDGGSGRGRWTPRRTLSWRLGWADEERDGGGNGGAFRKSRRWTSVKQACLAWNLYIWAFIINEQERSTPPLLLCINVHNSTSNGTEKREVESRDCVSSKAYRAQWSMHSSTAVKIGLEMPSQDQYRPSDTTTQRYYS